LSNAYLQLAGAIAVICGFVVVNFLIAVYISIKRMGGKLERRHVLVISCVALLFFLGGILLSYIGGITA